MLETIESNVELTESPRRTLGRELAGCADELRVWKRYWRTPADARPEPPAARFKRHECKQRATLLCLARAHARGRVHCRAWNGVPIGTLVEQARVLSEALERMDRMNVSEPLLDARERSLVRRILTAA